ncbi:MAG: Txe/YoeB family addiction module toxin [Bacteroidales bacterium]|nr:Txe/YoeB family addiction module toxin [Candidatus Sodaliphilus fimicaballi]
MTYSLEFSPRALKDLEKIKKAGNKSILNKIRVILLELMEHPLTGTGKPEPLRHRENTYSRRLSGKDRIVYSIHDNLVKVNVLQMQGHYDDK